MKTVYLVRHAKSSWKDEGIRDIDRPLKERGVNDAYVMGNLLNQKGINPSVIISSPAARAMHTAVILMRQMQYPREKFHLQPTIYESSGQSLFNIIKELDDNLDSVMLFGHNPTFTSLTNALANSNYYNIPTCGIAGINFSIDQWKNLEFGNGTISLYEIPKNHR